LFVPAPAIAALQSLTRTVPIVFVNVVDPVCAGSGLSGHPQQSPIGRDFMSTRLELIWAARISAFSRVFNTLLCCATDTDLGSTRDRRLNARKWWSRISARLH
jgi:hypothetical protein